MNRHVVAGLLGLALAGCAQNRSAIQSRGPSSGPVGLTSFPSIHETINRENPKFDPRSLRASAATHGPETSAPANGSAPRPLDVRHPESVALTPSSDAPSNPPPGSKIPLELVDSPDANGSTGAVPSDLDAAHTHPAPTESPAPSPTPAPDASASSLAPEASEPPAESGGMLPPTVEQAPDDPSAASPPGAVPETAPLPAPSEPPPAEAAPSLPAPAPVEGVGEPAAPASEAPPASAPAPENAPAEAPTEPALPAPADANMPGLEAAPPIAVPAEPPAGSPSEAPVPAPSPPPPALEAPPEMPPPPELPSVPPASASALEPAPGPVPLAEPGAELPKSLPEPAAPPIPPMLPPAPAEAASAPDVPPKLDSASAAKRDTEVQPTAADATMLQSKIRPRNAQSAGEVAARVGDEIITLNQLRRGVGQRLQGVDPSQPPSEQEVTMLAYSVLQELIERSIVVQEAKRELKKPEAFKMVMEDANKSWRAEELDPLLRKYAATNEYELKQKLKENGVSLDDLREAYCRHHLSQSYMKAKVGPKMTVSLPEMREYYLEHLQEFDRPAQIVWREVVIDFDKCKSRTEARAKADGLLGRLRRGEDFAKLATAESHGPNKVKGGIWETSPGGYGVAAVNAALESLPMGRISQVIEAPTSYHIVRVENRRAAGPASFAEVEIQDKIKNTIFNEKIRRETSIFIAKLRKQTLVTTMFDPPPNDPATIKAGMTR